MCVHGETSDKHRETRGKKKFVYVLCSLALEFLLVLLTYVNALQSVILFFSVDDFFSFRSSNIEDTNK